MDSNIDVSRSTLIWTPKICKRKIPTEYKFEAKLILLNNDSFQQGYMYVVNWDTYHLSKIHVD